MIPLLILGLLKECPGAHGYELLALMKERNYKYIVNFTKGSFYYNLQQMEEKELISRVEQKEENKSSSKETHNYKLTKRGDEKFQELMVQYGSKTDYVNLSFYGPMLFLEYYDTQEFEKLIHVQMEQTEQKIKMLNETLNRENSVLPSFAKMLENSVAHHQVNLHWYKGLLRDMENK